MRKCPGIILAALLISSSGCSWIPDPPGPPPTSCPEKPCADGEKCVDGTCIPDRCPMPNVPWCKDVEQTCSSAISPCKTNPTTDPYYCEEAVPCERPQCVLEDDCDCYNKHTWISCGVNPPPVKAGPCGREEDLVVAGNPTPVYHEAVKMATTLLGPLPGLRPQAKLAKLSDRLMWDLGVCVIAGKEAVFILRPDGLWEENHAVSFGDGGWTNSGSGKYMGSHSMDSPTCGWPDPTNYLQHAKFNLSKHGKLWDSTFILRQVQEYCTTIGYGYYENYGGLPRASCPLRAEGGDTRVCIERKVIGDQRWWCDGEEIEHTLNPAQAQCQGHVKTCTADGTVCAEDDW